jgi:hypothetical protein
MLLASLRSVVKQKMRFVGDKTPQRTASDRMSQAQRSVKP